MGTDIKAIVQRVFNEANLDKNQKLNKQEFLIFQQGLNYEVAKGTLSQDQMNVALFHTLRNSGDAELMRDYGIDQVTVTNPIQGQAPVKKEAIEYTNKDLTRAYRHIQNCIDASVKRSSSVEEFMANIEKQVGHLAEDKRYAAPFIERLNYIKDKYINNTYSYEVSTDIEDAHKETIQKMAQDEYKGLKLDNGFDLDLLDALETVAKKEVYLRTQSEITNTFETMWQTNLGKESGRVGVAAIIAELEEELVSSRKRDLNNDQKQALNYLKNNYAKERAEVTVLKALEEIDVDPELLKNFKLTVHKLQAQPTEVAHDTRRAIAKTEKALKEKLKADGLWDSYTKQVLRGWGFNDEIGSHLEDISIENKRTQYTKDDIIKKLDTKNRPLFEALVAQGLIREIQGSDKYDITNLSILISELAGADNTVNRTTGAFKTLSERKILMSNLKAILNDNMDKSDRKKLVELCGYRYEQINWAKVIGNAATFGLADAVETGVLTARNLVSAAVITGGDLVKFIGKIEVNFGTNVNITANTLKDLGLENIITIDHDGKTFIDITALKELPTKLSQIPPDYRTAIHAAYQAGVLGAAWGALKGCQSVEPPVTPTTLECQTHEQYINFINEHHKNEPDVIKALGLLSMAFIDPESGEWDCEEYLKFLHREGGYGSVLNKQELTEKVKDRIKEINVTTTPIENEEENTPPVIKKVTLKAGECTSETCRREDVVIKDATRSSWTEVLKQYDGCLEKTFGGQYNAIRVLKIAQAITDGNYSVERLQYLLDLSLKGSKYMKNIPGLDYDTYYNKLVATTMPKELKLPVKLGECDLINEDLNRAKFEDKDILKKGQKGYKEAGKPAIGTTSGQESEYWTKLGDEETITHKNKDAWNKYIESYEEADDVIIKRAVPCEEKE